jgi:hypothetical protein
MRSVKELLQVGGRIIAVNSGDEARAILLTCKRVWQSIYPQLQLSSKAACSSAQTLHLHHTSCTCTQQKGLLQLLLLSTSEQLAHMPLL